MANLQSLRKLWSGHSNTLTGLVALAVLAMVASTIWFQGAGKRPDVVDVLQVDLSRSEQNQIRLTLARESLNEFRFENNRLLVPLPQQSSYLLALTDAGALPDSLRGADQELPTINPFLSRGQQELVQQNYRQQQLRSVLVQLPFVEDARVQLDVQQGSSAFSEPDMRCVVSVWPRGKLFLEHQQLSTIHQNILAAIAGIEPDKIVINDLNSGFAWDSTRLKTQEPGSCVVQIERMRMVRQMEHDLEHSLTAWPGVGFAVEICPGCAIGLAQLDGRPLESLVSADTTPEIGPGTNSTAKVPAMIQPSFPMAPKKLEISDRVKVRLTVDNQAIDEFLQQARGKPAAADLWSNERKELADSVAVRERMKQELESLVRKQLAQSGQSADLENDIAIEFASALPVQGGLAGERRNFWSAANQGMLWAILPGLALCVLVVFSMSRRRGTIAVSPLAAQSEKPDVWLDDSNEVVNRQQIRQKIDELIENNPEAAARVIQSWIRDAA